MAQPEPTEAELNAGTEPEPKKAETPKEKVQKKQPSVKQRVTPKKPKPIPTPDGVQKLIIGCMFIAVANNAVANATKPNGGGKSAGQVVFGGFALTIGLLVISEFAPGFARGLAILILVASLVGPNGTGLINLVTKILGTQQVKTTPSTSIGVKYS